MSTAYVLIVEDEVPLCRLLSEYIKELGMIPVVALDGLEARELLEKGENHFKAILLDRMMPGMDGIKLLAHIKSQPSLRFLPVIFQTALSNSQSVVEGIEAGAFYYLSKPYSKALLQSIVKAAVSDFNRHFELRSRIHLGISTLGLMQSAQYQLRTLDEAQALASCIANAFPNPDRVAVGMLELLINAIEHGNLEIGFDEKTRLTKANRWIDEIERRLDSVEFSDRTVKVHIYKNKENVHIEIEDQGQGFKWQNFMRIDQHRLQHNHGRGIALAKALGFDALEYLGNGNRVRATVNLLSQVA